MGDKLGLRGRVDGVFRWLWEENLKPVLEFIPLFVLLIFSVLLPLAPPGIIAWLVDNYGNGWAWLFLPWALFLPTLLKPLGKFLEV